MPGQRVVLGERRDRAGRLGAPEDPLAPHHHHRAVPERGVAQQVFPASVGYSDHTAGSAPLDLPGGFDEQVQLTAELARGEHPHARHTEHHRCRTAATIATVHVTGAFIRSATWSLRIMKVPALTSPEPRCLGASPNHPQRRRACLVWPAMGHQPRLPQDDGHAARQRRALRPHHRRPTRTRPTIRDTERLHGPQDRLHTSRQSPGTTRLTAVSVQMGSDQAGSRAPPRDGTRRGRSRPQGAVRPPDPRHFGRRSSLEPLRGNSPSCMLWKWLRGMSGGSPMSTTRELLPFNSDPRVVELHAHSGGSLSTAIGHASGEWSLRPRPEPWSR